MFKVKKNLTCWWPVTVKEPDPEKPGEILESAFEVEFSIPGRAERKKLADEREALLAALRDTDDAEKATDIGRQLEAFGEHRYREAILNWRGIEGDEGPFEYSLPNLDLLLDSDYVRRALDAAYTEAVTLDKARLGN
ncbi:MAG: hypothetical protein ACK43M_14390 [Allorhizobium sp.]